MLGSTNSDSLDGGDGAKVAELVARLGSADGPTRMAARKNLVRWRQAAVIPLIAALQRDQPHVGWEAAKALGEIGDSTAAPALVEAMINADEDVSWVASESLISMGTDAQVPVLIGLLKYARFHRFRIGAHRVLSCLMAAERNSQLQAVIDALNSRSPELAAPVAAEKLLLELVPAFNHSPGDLHALTGR